MGSVVETLNVAVVTATTHSDRVIVGGKSAVILGRDPWYGWSTEVREQELKMQMLFDPELVNYLILNVRDTFETRAYEKYGHIGFFKKHSVPNCVVEYVDLDRLFEVSLSHCGKNDIVFEEIRYVDETTFLMA